MADWSGKHLGGWVIERELGRGGMGRVYLAHRDMIPLEGTAPQQAAVKVLAADLAQEAGFVHRFQREIDALSLLDHPHIVRFYESGQQDGLHFYAMEYVAGRNFEELLHEQKRLPWKDVLDMALQVCPALKHAHDHGIIHRDIKTQNLIRAEDGTVKLADFGVAKVFASRQLTAVNGVVGTAEYISPEQAAGKPVTVRSDLYSFGIVLYTLLTGRMPFEGKSVLDLLHKHRFGQFDRPQRIVEEVPTELDEIVCGLMEKDPAQRPANALMLQRQLEALRRKLEKKEQATVVSAVEALTRADNAPAVVPDEPGPATLMSRLVRDELKRQNRGGPVAEFLNRPAVVVTLLVACLGVVVWGLWPASAATLYARGAALMRSDNLADWETAWAKYLEPLERKYPGHPYAEQLQEYRQRLEDRRAEGRTVRLTRAPVAASEAQRFYLQGQSCRRDGDLVTARRLWQNLVETFRDVESEQRWVRLAEKGLAEIRDKLPADDERWGPVRAALKRAQELPRDESEKVWRAVEELYRDDPSAGPILQEVRAARAAQN